MRASFSSWCDEYYNLKMLLIGELLRSKAILERRQAAVKIQSTREKRNSSPHSGKSNLSYPVPALKQATLDMMKKDEEKKRKERKDKLKKQQKEERRQIYLKEKAQ